MLDNTVDGSRGPKIMKPDALSDSSSVMAQSFIEKAKHYYSLGDRERFLMYFSLYMEIDLDICDLEKYLLRVLGASEATELCNLFVKGYFKKGFDAKRIYDFLSHNFPVKRFVNIGGGERFIYPEWINVDINATKKYGMSHDLFPKSGRLPIDDGSMEIVYSSHCLEHLNDEQVSFVIREAKRLLTKGGAFLVKIPDFDWLLESYRKGYAGAFSDDLWNFPCATGTWEANGVEDCIENRCAYLFLGYWNEYFGNLFSDYNVDNPGAYNGPPKVDVSLIRERILSTTPKGFADFLASNYSHRVGNTFNHQNAWGCREFSELLSRHGFKVLSVDREEIVKMYSHIPGISDMFSISSYYFSVLD